MISDGRRIDGVLATAMTHDEAYVMWRLGRAIERADMTTRRARRARRRRALAARDDGDRPKDHDEVQWMGVLRSVWGLQMYQRAVRGPIEGSSVVRFLLEHDRFPRAVRALLREIRRALVELPDPDGRWTPSTTSRPCCASRRRRAPTGRRSTRRWTTCRSRSPSSTSGSPIATCWWGRDAGPAPTRRPPGAVSDTGELLEQFLHDHLALTRRQVEADRLIAASLAGHLVHELPGRRRRGRADRPWRLDPVPLVLDGRTFAELATAVTERLLGMEALLADLYGPRQAVKEGWVPAEALASSPRYRLAAVGAPPPPRWLTTLRGRGAAPRRRLVARRAGPRRHADRRRLRPDRPRRSWPASPPSCSGRRRPATWRRSAGSRPSCATPSPAPPTCGSPRIVLFSGGIDDPAYVEHSSLARLLGFHLVEAPDLVVRQGRLWLRTLGGLDPIDVVYRRLADAAVDPIEVSATNTTGVPGLLLAATGGRRGAGQRPRVGRARGSRPGARTGRAAIAGLAGTTLRLRPLAPRRRRWPTVPAFRDGRAGTAPPWSSGCTPSPDPTA